MMEIMKDWFGVVKDCTYIVNELNGAKFSVITFGDTARKMIPFTKDSDMVIAELKSINVENDYYAKGTSINLVKNVFEKTLKEEIAKNEDNTKMIVFFVSDGEITIEDEKLESFSDLKKYISDGVVMGYGTNAGGKMIDDLFKDSVDENGNPFYVTYFDEDYNQITGISKIDENNLKQIANDLGISYIKMDNVLNIDNKLQNLKKSNISVANDSIQKLSKKNYKDIYFYFAIPLMILFIMDFTFQKKRII